MACIKRANFSGNERDVSSYNISCMQISRLRSVRKARRTRAQLSRVLVIRDKLDRQNFLVCGQHLRHIRHS
jgi:hypothetical protein